MSTLYDINFLVVSPRRDDEAMEMTAFMCGTATDKLVFGEFQKTGYEDTLTDNT